MNLFLGLTVREQYSFDPLHQIEIAIALLKKNSVTHANWWNIIPIFVGTFSSCNKDVL